MTGQARVFGLGAAALAAYATHHVVARRQKMRPQAAGLSYRFLELMRSLGLYGLGEAASHSLQFLPRTSFT